MVMLMTMTEEQFKNSLREWEILINEEMNIALDTNWGQKFKWETAVSFACMIDDVNRINTVTDLLIELESTNKEMLLAAINHDLEQIPLDIFDKEELQILQNKIQDELDKDRGY